MISPNDIRQIHLDFHTPGFVRVGDQWNVMEFYDTLEDSRVNSLAFFAKCHHGYSYFDTEVGTRHPGLDFDMFGQASQEAAKRGIDFVAYFSLNVDEVIAREHPEWVALHEDGRPVDSQRLQDDSELYWRWLCPNRGTYLESFFYPHVEECLRKYPVDGVFIDMAGYLPGSCFCPGCMEGMRQLGLDIHDEREHNRFNAWTMKRFAARLREIMDKHRPGMRLQIGCFNGFGEAKNAVGIASEFYVESLSFQTGWFHLPIMARYLGNTGMPVNGLTGRFLKSWGDFGTVLSPHQLRVQVAAQLSVGASCGIGDHMHCNGKLDKAVYSVIKDVYTFATQRQKYCTGMERAREVAILVPDGIETNAAVVSKLERKVNIFDSLYGSTKLLMEGHYQWDVRSREMGFAGCSTLVLIHPFLDAGYIAELQRFVESGGTLVVDTGAVQVDGGISGRWLEFLGLESAVYSSHSGSYYRVCDGSLADGLPEMAHYVHAPSLELSATVGTRALAQAFYPPCVRSRETFYGHFHGPDMVTGGTAISLAERGNGRVVVLGQSVISAYLNTGYHAHRTLMHNLIDSTLPGKIVRTNAPSLMEITVGRKDGRTVIQFVPFIADRRHRYSFESLNDVIPIRDVSIALRVSEPVNRLWNPVSGENIEFVASPGEIRFLAPEIIDHLVLVAEHPVYGGTD